MRYLRASSIYLFFIVALGLSHGQEPPPRVSTVEFQVVTRTGTALPYFVNSLKDDAGTEYRQKCRLLTCRDLTVGKYTYSLRAASSDSTLDGVALLLK